MEYIQISNRPITLSHISITPDQIFEAIRRTNQKFAHIGIETAKMALDIFNVIDFRVFSGMLGEAYATTLEEVLDHKLVKNPSIDGYPDLLQNVTPEMQKYFKSCGYEQFLDYKYGGIEVKNTFGTKKNGAPILMGDQRIGYINDKLDWKAHHRKTNHLLALFSDYYNGRPVIAAVFYSDSLTPDDWQKVQRPKEGSTMTSFSTIEKSGCEKLRKGMMFCLNDPAYLEFFGVEVK